MAVFDVRGSDFIVLSENGAQPSSGIKASDTIVLFESAVTDFISSLRGDNLGLNESITAVRYIPTKLVVDQISFSEGRFPFNVFAAVSDSVALSDTVTCTVNVRGYVDQIFFSESITAYTLTVASDKLTFLEYATAKRVPVASRLSDTLILNDFALAYINSRPITVCETILPSSQPVRFKLDAYELDLRHYEFGNQRVTDYSRINRESLGGTPLVSRVTLIVNSVQLNFILTSESLANELLNFLDKNIGRQIEFRDHEGVWHDAVPISDQVRKSEPRPGIFNISDVVLELLS